MSEVQKTRICAEPGCHNTVTNPQAGYCDPCLEFKQLVYDLETPRFEQELADYALDHPE